MVLACYISMLLYQAGNIGKNFGPEYNSNIDTTLW